MSKRKLTSKRGQWKVVAHNDDQHTFDEIISALMDICGHNYYQAHQCATIIHNNGQYPIFIDKHDLCLEVYEELLKEGIRVSIKKL